jgi:hypothetical protein
MWRCPHCGAPQAESARCWVCRRSSTTCSTCRHFQTALAADGGWCALDPKRLPLTGREQRGCWQGRRAFAPPSPADIGGPDAPRPRPSTASGDGASRAPAGIDFIPVDLIAPIVGAVEPMPPHDPTADVALAQSIPAVMPEPGETWVERTSLFGELEA